MDDDTRNLSRMRQSDVLPGSTRIRGLIHAVAMTGGYAANRRLTRADVDDIDVRLGNSDGTDGANVKVIVRDVFPGDAGIHRLPYTTTRCPHVIKPGVARHAGHSRNTAAAPWANQAPFKRRYQLGINSIFRECR